MKPSPTFCPQTFSIVVATAGRAASLDRTLQSLRQLRYPQFEVVAVLGPSSDDSANVVDRHSDLVRSCSIDRLNLAAARNIGIAMSKGDIIAFIDDDAVPEPDWLDRLLDGYQDPTIAQVGGFIRDNLGFGFQCKYLLIDRFGDSIDSETLPERLDDEHFLGLTGTNFSARRDRLLSIGGFDEEFAYFLDETDVTLRLLDQGWSSRVMPDAEVHHKFEASHLRTAARVPKSMYATARSKAYFSCVHWRGRKPLVEVFAYLAEFLRKERAWKTDLFRYGHTDQATSDRLVGEVERGVRDGVRDAFLHRKPQTMLTSRAVEAHDGEFRRFRPALPAPDRLRICLMSQDYPPSGCGGIGQWTMQMAQGLAGRGHEVTVICRSDKDYPYIDFVAGIWVHRIVTQSVVGDYSGENLPVVVLGYSAAIAAEIERIQPRRQFQVVCGPIFDLEPLIALRRSGIATVVSLQTTYKLALPHKPDWTGNAWYRASHVDKIISKERELLETAPFLLANSPGLVADLEDRYGVELLPERVQIISHGIADPVNEVGSLEAWVRTDPRSVRVLFVGRLELRKGVDILLDALPKLLRDYRWLEVDLVGEDDIEIQGSPLRARYEDRWRRERVDTARVRFHGKVSREVLLRHYADCDLFVAPSRYESFGLIYVEAMAFSKPVIAMAVGGVTDLVEDGVSGLLIAEDSPHLLAAAIGRLVDDSECRLAMGAAGRQIYERRFAVERMLDAGEAYFRNIAKNHVLQCSPPIDVP